MKRDRDILLYVASGQLRDGRASGGHIIYRSPFVKRTTPEDIDIADVIDTKAESLSLRKWC